MHFFTLLHHDEAEDEDDDTECAWKVAACLCYLTNESHMQSSHSFSFLATTFMQAEGFNAENNVEFFRKSMAHVGVEDV